MATSTNSYASVHQVETMVGDVVPARAFSITSIPSVGQVEQQIDLTAAELNRALGAAGYTVPVSTGTDPIAHKWLEGINAYGAAAGILGMVPSVSITLDSEDAATNRMQRYQRLFDRALQDIEEHKLDATKVITRLGQTFAGAQEDSGGNRKLPLMTRNRDFDSHWSFTE